MSETVVPGPEGRPGEQSPGAAPPPDQDSRPPDESDNPVTGLAEATARAVDLEDRWRRALADLDNLRKRTDRQVAEAAARERAAVAGRWLPVLDNLELALAHAKPEPDPVIDGVRAVRDQAVAVLADLGFPRQDDVGQPFDPARHEAVGTVSDVDAPPGTVVAVVRPGYGAGERQLRPAAVVVATRDE